MPKKQNLTNQKFNMLTVIKEGEPYIINDKGHKRSTWVCQCDCGNITTVAGNNLKAGRVKSCGCAKKGRTNKPRDLSSKVQIKNNACVIKWHKQCPSEYDAWRNMRSRCNNTNDRAYQYYGGIGVRVCPEWDDFLKFLSHIGTKPSPDLTLDRIDPHGNYEPGNVRWATWVTQRNNRRNK